MLSGCFLSSCYVSLVPQPFSEVCCPVEPNWSHPAAPSPDSWTKFSHSCESNSTMTGAVVKQPVENQMPWIKTSLDDIVLPLRKLIFLNPSKAMQRQHRQAMLRSMPLGAWLARELRRTTEILLPGQLQAMKLDQHQWTKKNCLHLLNPFHLSDFQWQGVENS